MKKQFPKTEDLQAERATDERIPFSVIRTFVDSLGKDPTPELEHILQNSFSYAPDKDEISVRTLRSDRIKFIGLLEYRSVTLGVPEHLTRNAKNAALDVLVETRSSTAWNIWRIT